jgi:hypothetical protein
MKLRRALFGVAAAAVLALVFMADAQPALMLDLSNQIWACF